ncbi:MAG: hypothetical protein HKO57_04180 [Akkermansiaceae bacterium]|nr:hypothetical protein [Akkermansiaceae bacterium]
MLVRAGGTWSYSGPPATTTVDGVAYSIAGSATLPVSGAVNVLEGTTVITTGLPSAPADYEYKSFILEGSVDEGLAEGYFQATVTPAP